MTTIARSTGPARLASFRTIARDVAALQIVIGGAMSLPLLVSLIYVELYTAMSFAVAAVVTAGAGFIVHRACLDAPDPERRHALIIAAAGWMVSSIFGSLPFLFAAWWTPLEAARAMVPAGASYEPSLLIFRNPLHGIFETMSGFTTTGLTMAVHEPSIGHGLLFYRSLAQWIGGVGVIVLSLAIIPRPRAIGGLELYQSETAGMKLRPTILGTARSIWKIYLTLTTLLIVYLFAGTALILPDYPLRSALFDSVNHAMTGLATGGFSTLDDSIAGYRSYGMDLLHILPMVLGVVSIPLYYTFVRERDVRVFWKDPQFRLMTWIMIVTIPLLVIFLVGNTFVPEPLRESIFQIVSGVSGTGWQTSAIGNWSSPAVLLLGFGTMVIGGAAGSTAGGFKLIRAFIVLHAVRWRVRKVFLPANAMLPFRVGKRVLSRDSMQQEISDASIVIFLYLAVLGASILFTAAMAPPEFTLADAIFESVSAQGTVGLSTGITDPSMPVLLEILFILQMWAGRLEVFPILILLRAFFIGAFERS